MTITGPLLFSPEKRQQARVIFTRSVKVYTEAKLQGQYPSKNLSLGGLFIVGDVTLPVGADCRLELHETGRRSSLILTFNGKILRRENEGVAVKFTDMAEDSFMFLQTMVLYSSDDPIGVAEHFLEEFVPNSRPEN
jgi:hypothetical protein